MDIALHGFQVVLGLVFVAIGAGKVAGAATTFALGFARFGYPRWFLTVTGLVEVLGGIGLLVGMVRPELGVVAAALLIATLLGAALTHLRVRDGAARVAPPLVLLALVVAVGLASFGG
jgi:uncharacterized membrane protein YphA (DoxX/SURF4 family)